MNTNPNLSPRTIMAASAMLMLSSGMARAQEAVEITVPSAPQTAAPATPPPAAPTIVLPEPAPVAATAAPVVAQAVAPEPTAAPRATATPQRSARTVSAAAPVAVAPVADRAPAPVAAQPVPVEPVPQAQTLPPPAEVATTGEGSDWALPVGAAATLLVLGGVGLAMTRRRRTWEADADFVPPVVNRPATRPMAERPVDTERPAAATIIANTAAPTTTDDRAELIERMVAAAPDEANPFTSRKARRRRARLIVQSMPQAAREPALIRAPQYAERPLQDHRVLASF